MCIMKHWPLKPHIFLSIEQSNNYDASSGPLHTSQLQKERINVLGCKLSELLSVRWLDQYALYHFPMEMKAVLPNSCICPIF